MDVDMQAIGPMIETMGVGAVTLWLAYQNYVINRRLEQNLTLIVERINQTTQQIHLLQQLTERR